MSLYFATIKVHSGGFREIISKELSSKKLLLVKKGMMMFKCAKSILDVESSDEGVNREGVSYSDDIPLPP